MNQRNKPTIYLDAHTHQDVADGSILAIRNIIIGQDMIEPEQVTACSVGIHPWYAADPTLENWFEQLRQWANLPTVLAIGECGLDRLTNTPLSEQQAVFEQHIQLAETVQKPLIIHCVRAFPEIITLRKLHQRRQPWVIHGFNNRLSLLEPLLSAGFYISLGAALLKADSAATRALTHIPLDRFLLETDDKAIPIQEVYRATASLLNIGVSELANQLWKNAVTVFPAFDKKRLYSGLIFISTVTTNLLT